MSKQYYYIKIATKHNKKQRSMEVWMNRGDCAVSPGKTSNSYDFVPYLETWRYFLVLASFVELSDFCGVHISNISIFLERIFYKYTIEALLVKTGKCQILEACGNLFWEIWKQERTFMYLRDIAMVCVSFYKFRSPWPVVKFYQIYWCKSPLRHILPIVHNFAIIEQIMGSWDVSGRLRIFFYGLTECWF